MSPRPPLVLGVLALGGCPILDRAALDDRLDGDGDGAVAEAWGGPDCNDADPAIHPLAEDPPYDGTDADCGGGSDFDADGDGHDAVEHGGDDCEDADPTVHPGAVDVAYDGVDADCAGDSDYDADHDGFDGPGFGGSDCNDRDSSVHPGAAETWYDGVDQDCDGASDFDQDGDGDPRAGDGGLDCDDEEPTVGAGAVEVCDGLDNDCDGTPDDDAVDAGSWYPDVDGDGYGDDSVAAVLACALGTGAPIAGDCDDGDAAVNPLATEVFYDGIDADCDGASDFDADGDGHDWMVFGGLDCDDADPTRHPDAPEDGVDAVDDDCDFALYRTAVLDDALPMWVGVDDGLQLGIAAVGADLDGDGVRDLAIGGDGSAGPSPGAVYVFSGPFSAGAASTASADAVIQHPQADGQLGDALAALGDVDGDTFPDLAVGAPYLDAPAGTYRGRVFVVPGPLSGVRNPEVGGPSVWGGATGDALGLAVHALGDATGDGVPDLVATAPGANVAHINDGAAFVLPRVWAGDQLVDDVALAVRYGAGADDNAGLKVASLDANGDGVADLLLGSEDTQVGGVIVGATYLELGPLTGVASLATADARAAGGNVFDQCGHPAGGADLTGDGLEDAIVGCPGTDEAQSADGAVYLWTWPQSDTLAEDLPTKWLGEASFDALGRGSTLGDFDGDGQADLWLGAFGADALGPDSGAVYYVPGPVGSGVFPLEEAALRLSEDPAQFQLGATLFDVGDATGDGVSDVLVGAQFNGLGAPVGGAAYLVDAMGI